MSDPPESRPPEEPERRRDPAPPGSPEEALRRIEERLDRASEAAERLMAQAAHAAAGGSDPDPGESANPGEDSDPPPAGWQLPDDGPSPTWSDLDPFVAFVQAVRELIPADLQRRLIAALRELLLALRALIDWYLERLERRRGQAVEVQDIPIL
ncbi:MAG TPA: hypothetical protein VMF57_19150 [Solirubrobacteraceae bacterium]|nr:hypothetical protein [Solirubrobacteraceae bacterium]